MKLARSCGGALLALAIAVGTINASAQDAQGLDPALAVLAQQETDAVLETLRALTAVDSGSGQAAGLLAVVEQIERFVRPLGGEVQRVTPAAGVAGPNLVITFKGTGKRRIMLMAHMDTVYPAGTAAARPFRREGNRAIAPGIADDKGGIAMFLHAMKLLHARGFRDYERVTMVFNSDEERASAGSRDLIRTQAGAHDFVLSGEPTGDDEVIVLGTSGVGFLNARVSVGTFGSSEARPIEELADALLRSRDVQQQVANTRMNWTVMRAEDGRGVARLATGERHLATLRWRVEGRASHAGNNPGGGINAVMEVADLVRRVGETAATLPGARLHWRAAGGGLVNNVIPDRGHAVAELSLAKDADLAAALKSLEERGAQASIAGARISFESEPTVQPPAGGTAEAQATADVRVPDAAAFATLTQAARQALGRQKFPGPSVAVQENLIFPAFNASPEGHQLAAFARDLYQQLGGQVTLIPRTYGGTDAAWAGQSGKPVMENLGLPGGNYHSSEEEYVLVDRIPRRLALVAEMIRALARR